MVVLRQKNQHAPGNADLGRQACAFGANRVFDDLHHQGLSFKHLLFYRNLGLGVAGDAGGFTVGLTVPDIRHMQKRSALQTNIDKGGLHARQHPGHFAQVDIAHQAPLQRALHMQLLQGAVFDNCHPRFLG